MSFPSILRSAYGWLVGREDARHRSIDAGFDESLFGSTWAVQSATGVRIDQQTAMACDVVWACVKMISEDVAKLRPQLVRKFPDRSRALATDNPLFPLLRAPNDWQTWQEFAWMMMVGLLLRGNGYAVIVRNGRGQPQYLVPINPDRVALWEAPGGELFYRVTRAGLHELAKLASVPLLVPARDVFHLKGLSANGLLGLSTIALNRESIGLALAQEQQAARWMGNAARPSGILTTDQKMTQDAYDRSKKAWIDAQAGLANSGKTAMLEMGLKWQPLSMTSQDVEFIASRTFQLNAVARLWRVPPHMIGELTKATNNSLTQLSQEYVNYTLSTYTEIWSQRAAFTFGLPDDVELLFDMSVLLRGDIAARYQNYRLGQQGWLTTNEIRDAEGLDPVDDGDVIFRPVNMAPLGSDVFEANALNGEGNAVAGVGSDQGGDNPGGGRPSDSGPTAEQDPKRALGVAPRSPFRLLRYNHNHGQHGWFSSSAFNTLGDMPSAAISSTFGRELSAGKIEISREVRRHSDIDHPGDYVRAKPDIEGMVGSPLFLGTPRWRGSAKNGTQVTTLYGPLSDGSKDWLAVPAEMSKDLGGRYRAQSLYIVKHADVQRRIADGSIVSVKKG